MWNNSETALIDYEVSLNFLQTFFSAIPKSKEIKTSRLLHAQAFLCNAPFPEDLINYSRICFTQGNMKESKKAMEDAIKVGFQYFPGLDENLHIIVDYTFFTLNYFVYSSYQTKKYLAFV